MIRGVIAGAACVVAVVSCLASAADVTPDYVTSAVENVARPPGLRALDGGRKPAEVIAFSGLRPGQHIIDLMPGSGYWTRIFAKVVGPRGKVYSFVARERRAGASAVPQAPRADDSIAQILGIQHSRGFENVLAIQSTVSAYGGSVGVPTQVDMVWTAWSYHAFHGAEMGPLDMGAINRAIFRAMKPGGTYLVIDHAAAPGTGFSAADPLQRAEKQAVKAEILAAGFEFVAESSLLANAADDRSRPAADLDGSSDQFVLKFRKPVGAPATDRRPGVETMRNLYGNTFVLGTPLKRFRTLFYHPDGVMEEVGMADMARGAITMQSAYWFWDADGHNCMLHQYDSAPTEGVSICHPWSERHSNARLNEPFLEYGSNGQPAVVSVVPGHVYPNYDTWVKDLKD